MAVTPNLNLYKPDGEDYVSLSRDLNENYEKIDTAVGSNSDAIANNEGAIAIVCDGNNHVNIASGQYVYIKNHSTLAEGLYSATAAIGANNNPSGSVQAVSGGGLNALNSNIATKADIIASENNWIESASVTLKQHSRYLFLSSRYGDAQLITIYNDPNGGGNVKVISGTNWSLVVSGFVLNCTGVNSADYSIIKI